MGLLNVVLVAMAQKQGFEDGVSGRPVAFHFTEGFPQYTEKAKAYHKGYKEGQKSRRLRIQS